jgi:acyl carrier protein
MSSTLDRLTNVFRDVFGDDDLVITREPSADDVPEWDSLKHVTLIVSVEREFGRRFKSSDISALKNVGDLVDLIER